MRGLRIRRHLLSNTACNNDETYPGLGDSVMAEVHDLPLNIVVECREGVYESVEMLSMSLEQSRRLFDGDHAWFAFLD